MKKAALFVTVLLACALLLSACTMAPRPVEEGLLPTSEAVMTEPAQDPDITEPDAGDTNRPGMILPCLLLNASGNVTLGNAPRAEESQIWFSDTVDPEAEKELTAYFLGEEYTGVYRSSRFGYYYTCNIDYYGGGGKPEFGVRSDNGELVFINLKGQDFYDAQAKLPELDDPDSASKELACEFVGNLVDTAGYECSLIESRRWDRYGDGSDVCTYYTYRFDRMMGDYRTADFVWVEVTSKGGLACLRIGTPAVYETMLDHEDELASIDVEGSVRTALDGIEVKNGELSDNFTVTDKLLVLTPGGERAVMLTVEAEAVLDSEPASAGFVMLMYLSL